MKNIGCKIQVLFLAVDDDTNCLQDRQKGNPESFLSFGKIYSNRIEIKQYSVAIC
jgi:hypothetical protein